MSTAPLGPRVLEGRFVRLEPVGPEHAAELRAAADDPETWQYMPFEARGAGFDAWLEWIARETAKGEQLSFAVRRRADEAIVGSTSYLAIAREHARVEIGATWYVAGARGGRVNPEAKLLLFANAFEAGYRRVELKTDARNARSRAAILKLGAREEGTLRAHMRLANGRIRDTVYYSVLAEEWPAVRAGLEKRLMQPG